MIKLHTTLMVALAVILVGSKSLHAHGNSSEASKGSTLERRSVLDKDLGGKRISTLKASGPQVPLAGKHEIYQGCGNATCFGMPSGCISDGSCSLVVSVSMAAAVPNNFTFQILGTNSPGYVSVGLSNDDKMGDDQVVACNAKTLEMYMTNGHHVEKIDTVAGVELGSVDISDGNLFCSFTRPAKTTVKNILYDLQKTQYYLLIASGKMEGDTLGIHDNREASSSALNLAVVADVKAKSSLLYRLHGTFMLAAWIGFAGTGMLIARYFKKTWVGKKLWGKDIWFSWHQGFMVITWVLTCVAFIIIFVEVGGWYSATENPHAVLGVITTALVFFQPFGALMRPGPQDPKRPYFNWGHWGVGNLSHLLAIITIFYAKLLAKAELPEWNDYIVATYVAFHVFMHILFYLTDYCAQRPADKRPVKEIQIKFFSDNERDAPRPGENFPMKDTMNKFPDSNRDAPLSYLRRILLAIYLVVVTLLTIALIIVAAQAPIENN